MSPVDPVSDQSNSMPTGKTLDAMAALSVSPLTWFELRKIVGTNRGLTAVYRRMRAHDWIAFAPAVPGESTARYALTATGRSALDHSSGTRRARMAGRLDVRRMLIRRGWQHRRGGYLAVEKGNVCWAPVNEHGDSSLSLYEDRRALFTVGFGGDVPARVIVAACEAAITSSHSALRERHGDERA